MRDDLLKELIAQNDCVFEALRQYAVIGRAVVPDSSFTEKVEPGAMDNLGLGRQSVRPKKDRGAKDPFERGDQSPILLSALAHSERLQHLRSGSETNCLIFLLHRQRCEKDWNDPILAEGNAIIWVAGDLKDETAVPPFVKQLAVG